LRALLAVLTLAAVVLAVAHYCLEWPGVFRLLLGIFGFVLATVAAYCMILVAPLTVVLWLERRRKRK
jgi:hypothetical protein